MLHIENLYLYQCYLVHPLFVTVWKMKMIWVIVQNISRYDVIPTPTATLTRAREDTDTLDVVGWVLCCLSRHIGLNMALVNRTCTCRYCFISFFFFKLGKGVSTCLHIKIHVSVLLSLHINVYIDFITDPETLLFFINYPFMTYMYL